MAVIVIPVTDIKRLIAILIGTGKIQVIDSLNRNGNQTMYDLTDIQLYEKLFKIYETDKESFWKIITDIEIDRTSLTPNEIYQILTDLNKAPNTTARDRNFMDSLKESWKQMPETTTISSTAKEIQVPTFSPMTTNIVVGSGIVAILGLIFVPSLRQSNKKNWWFRGIMIFLITLFEIGFIYVARNSKKTIIGERITAEKQSNISEVFQSTYDTIKSWWTDKTTDNPLK